MGKENESDSVKKRRKSVSANSGTSMKDGDMYKIIINYEEKEAVDRLSEDDSECFLATCNDIRAAMSKIAKLKSSGDSNVKDDIRELQIQTSLAFIELKKLNRMEKFRTKSARDSLVAAKSRVDSRHLHLQNLLYEVMHLKKEVIKCLQFKSKDELIELVSEEEFYKEAPESISRHEITKNNSHQLRLARLEWELTQRKQLAALCDELTESKKAVASSIETKQTRLDNLAPQLRSILEASKPLQESLGLPLDKIRQEHQKASLLASPLYVLYAKASAYRDAYDSTLLVKVEGDEDEAKRANNHDGLQESDSDPENQLESIVEETPVHKKRHHRLSREVRQEEKRSKLLQRHPLHVKILITLKRLESPNPANQYQLSRHNLGSFSSLGLGIPYRWAQRMSGLHFVSCDMTEQQQKLTSQELAQDCVESVLKEIKRRIKARLDLCMEIRQLESGNLPIFISMMDPVPQKISTSLHRFTTMTWKNYSNYIASPEFYQRGLVLSVDIFYEAVLRRGSSELVARIAIKPDYPKIAPVFSISISPIVPASADIIRDIEREVNVMWNKSPTLTAQIQRLRACFDIYLETESMAPKEKIFFYPVRGRTRARPYKYLSLGGGIFTHR
ncbi:THOC5 protein, partial [Pseudoatta argentina]